MRLQFIPKAISLMIVACLLSSLTFAQTDRVLPAESAVNSTGQVTIKGKVVPYKVTAGTQPVWNAEGKPSASLFYTYYERTDVTDKSKRPFEFTWQGNRAGRYFCRKITDRTNSYF